MRYLVTGIIFLLGALMGHVPTVHAQQPAGEAESEADAMQIAFADGVTALQEGDPQEATPLLRQVFLDVPTYYDAEQGSAAYWLGRAYASDEAYGRARSVWRAGIIGLNARDRFDVPLSDAFVRRVFADNDRANYTLASAAYLRLLQEVGSTDLTERDRAILTRHLRYLALIMPDAARERAGVPVETAITADVLPSVDGHALMQWWRREDPFPATQRNERVREHLQRVTHAQLHYAAPDRPSGLDARGEIYIRLGEPDETVEIHYNETRLTEMIFSPGISINLSDFPDNEFWSYGQMHRNTYYIFVQKQAGAPFEIGTVEDLVPRRLRSGFSSGARGTERSMLMLATLRAAYRKFAPFHPELAQRHDEVANYIADIEQGGSLNPQQYQASVYAQKTAARTRNLDAQAKRRRENTTPQQRSTLVKEDAQLAVAVRTARFLNADGTTRTEVYWAPAPGALVPTDAQLDTLREQGYESFAQSIIRLTATQQAANYQSRVVNQKHYRLTDLGGGDVTIPARTFTTEQGDSGLYHVDLQWDQYLTQGRRADGSPIKGPRLKVATLQKDSLRALTGDERLLEMSDVRPMVLPEGSSGLIEQEAIPYPFEEVTPETALTLYFEAYHLPFGADDKTEYTVEYRVQRKTERGGLVRLFRGEDERSTTVSTTNQGTSRTAKEYILLDLAEWDVGTDTTLTVTVRVIDEESGQSVERDIDFRLVPEE